MRGVCPLGRQTQRVALMAGIITWFTAGAARSLLPWLIVFGLGLSVGTTATWAGWSLKHQAYKGAVAEAKLTAVAEALERGKEAGKKAAEERAALTVVTNQVKGQRDNAVKVIQDAKIKNPSFTSVDCAWPDSVRDEYNAIGANTVSRR